MNKLLSEAWVVFAKSLESGEVLELEAQYKDWVSGALDETVHVHADVG